MGKTTLLEFLESHEVSQTGYDWALTGAGLGWFFRPARPPLTP
jgi:hypothetical protein